MKLNMNIIADSLGELEQKALLNAHAEEQKLVDVRTAGFQASVESLDAMLKDLSTSQLSNEGLVEFFTKIGDVILGIGNTFKTLILKGGNRSEIRYFYESNVMNVNKVEARPFADIKDIAVDFPTGMTSSYKDAAAVIGAVYSALNMQALISEGTSVMDQVLASMSRGATGHEAVVENATRQLEVHVKRQEQAMAGLNKVFPDKGQPLQKKPFGELFASTEELKTVRVQFFGMEKTLLSCTAIRKAMEEMADSVELAVGVIKDSVEGELGNDPNIKFAYVPSQKFVQTLANYVRFHALALSNFSDAVNVHMASEHNLGLVYTTLIKS